MKKLLFTLIACLTVLSVNAKTAYFLNDDSSWGTVYAYAWNTDNDKNGNWPGILLQNTNTRVVDGVTYYYYECDYANIIFNAGNNNPQTKNLEGFSDGAVYSAKNNNNSNGSIDQIGTITKQPDGSYTFTKAGEVILTKGFLYFPVSTFNNNQAFLYTWGPVIAGNHPGTQLTRETINNVDFWVFTINDDREINNVTFNGVQLNTGSSSNQFEKTGIGPVKSGYYIDLTTGKVGPVNEYKDSGVTLPDWYGAYVNLLYSKNGFSDNGVQLNDINSPVAEFKALNIGDGGFRVKFWSSSTGDVVYSNDETLVLDENKSITVTLPKNDNSNSVMYVKGASSDATFDVTFNYETKELTLTLVGGTIDDSQEAKPYWYEGWVNLMAENLEWTTDGTGVQLNDAENPVATFSDFNLANKKFNIKFWSNSTGDQTFGNGQNIVLEDNKFSGTLSLGGGDMTVTGASDDATFDVTFNIETKEFTIELKNGTIEENPGDKVLYVVGEATNWLENKVQMQHEEGTNIWTLTSSEVFGQPWKICDGTWDWNFGMGDIIIKDEENDAWFNSQSDFSAISGNVTVTFTLIEGSDYHQSSTASKIKFTTDGDVKKITYLKGTFNKWEDNYAYYIDEDNKVATWDKVELFAVPEGANQEQKGQIKIHSFDEWWGSNEPVKLNTWTDCSIGENNNIVIDDDSAHESKLYLVKFNTDSHQIWVETYDFYLIFDNNELDRSYKFQHEGGEISVLSVASIPAGKKFYIGNGGSMNYTIEENMDEEYEDDGFELKPFTEDNYSSFKNSLINVTFTLTTDYESQRPFTIEWDGNISDELEGLAIHLGNDKTNQSGDVNDNKQQINISIAPGQTGAVLYVVSPKDESAPNGCKQVYYKLEPNAAQNNTRRAVDSDFVAATYDEASGAHTITLPEGTGTISLDYDGNPSEEAVPYTYTVTKDNVPVGVEGIGADEAEAEYYTLQGVKVANPEKGGIYIKVVAGKANKVIL